MNIVGLSHINPGDMIMWVYRATGVRVNRDETIWSSEFDADVPIGELALVINVNAFKNYSWISDKGLFSASVYDQPFWMPHHANIIKSHKRPIELRKVC